MRGINKIIIHCSATTPGMDIGVDEIRRWHMDRGWDDVGYHRIIRRDGTLENGRPIDVIGAHALGQNTDSIGVCLIGGVDYRQDPDCNYTAAQWTILEAEVSMLQVEYGPLTVHGHREFSDKDCPCFDVKAWWKV